MKKLNLTAVVIVLMFLFSSVSYAGGVSSNAKLMSRTNAIKKRNSDYRKRRDAHQQRDRTRINQKRKSEARATYSKFEKIRKSKLHENNKKDFRRWTPAREKSNNPSNSCLYNYETRKLVCRDWSLK